MGTHPIFESDFDCLTEKNMDEASKRVTGVLDEFQKKQDDFVLDAMIKTGGGALVGLSLGILTKRLVRVRSTVFAGTCMGLGMSVERYSQQLSAPYVSAPDCEVAPRPPMFKGTFREHLPAFLQPEVLTTKVEETAKEETPKNEAEVIAEPEEAAVEAEVAEVVEAAATEETAQVSIVDAVAAELKKELHEAATEVDALALDVEVAAQDVDAAAQVVENVAEKAEIVFSQADEVVEVAQTIEHVAEQVEQVAEKVEQVAEEVKEATE